MPRTNKKEQPKCNPSTSAFFIDEKAKKQEKHRILMNRQEMVHPQNSLKQKKASF